MNWRVSIGSILIAILTSTQGFSEPASQPQTAIQNDSRPAVDVELVIAVDVSYSVEPDVLAAQREAYAQAIASETFLQALRAGAIGKIALTYFEWSATGDQKIIVPWRQIDGPRSAAAVAAEMTAAPIRRGSRTSISSAIKFAVPLFEQSPYRGARRIIDISGDGPNSNGDPVTTARDAALQQGIVITGLPVMTNAPDDPKDFQHIDHIDWYYEDCVIGGPGSFVLPITGRENFKDAIQTKLALEVAGRTPKASTAPSVTEKPRVLCTIGEKLWQERWLSNSPATFAPPAKSPVANGDALKTEDAALSKKIKGICRGC